MMGSEQSLFKVIKGENFTSLTARYDWQNDDLQLSMTKDWTNKVDWAGRTAKGVLKRGKKLGNSETRDLLYKHNLDNCLDEVSYLIRMGKHRRVAWYYDPVSQARCLLAIHNKQPSYVVGNLRKVLPTTPRHEMLTTTLNLARNMSYRCAVAQLSCGGASLSFQPAAGPEDLDISTGFLEFLIEREDIRWGTGYGFSDEEIEKLEGNTSKVIVDKDKKGDAISVCAAAGVYMAIEEALAYRYEKGRIEDKLIAIQGMDKIGGYLGEKLLKDGADLIVCDINPAKIEAFLKNNQKYKSRITVVSPNEIKLQMGHVFSPNGQGHVGFLSRDSIRDISYHIIVGGTVQLLQGKTQQEEITLADRLSKKGILYIPDWLSTMGSLMYAIFLIEGDKHPDVQKIQEKINEIGRPALREILESSQKKGISPLEEAYGKFNIYNQDPS